MVSPKYHVFICTGCRLDGTQSGVCIKKDSRNLLMTLMQEVEELDLTSDVMINNTGCFGICQKGPVMVVYPEGTWYGNLDEDAIIKIAEEHFENGNPVEEYMI